jgi:hypothetical protein
MDGGTGYGHGPVVHEPVIVPNPATGTRFVHTVPGTCRQRAVVVTFTLTAAGGGGVRTPFVEFQDQTGRLVGRFGTAFTLASGNATTLTFGIQLSETGAINSALMNAPLPDCKLESGMRVVGSAVALGAADTLTGIALFVDQWDIRPEYDDETVAAALAEAQAASAMLPVT